MSSKYYEQRRDELHREWVALSNKRPYAWILIVAGGAFFVSNLLGVEEPTNKTLGAITLGAFGAGCFWLWDLSKEMNRIVARSLDNKRAWDEAEDSGV